MNDMQMQADLDQASHTIEVLAQENEELRMQVERLAAKVSEVSSVVIRAQLNGNTGNVLNEIVRLLR